MASRGKEKELVLIGTVHRDPDGAGRLRRLLASEGPAAVAVELSPYGLFYRRKNGRRLQRRLLREIRRLTKTRKVSWWEWGQIRAVWAQLAVPYEYRSAVTYCRDMGRSLSCLDSSRWSKYWIDTHWQQLLSRDNLTSLLEQIPENLRHEVGRDYQLAAILLGDGNRLMVSALSRKWSADSCWQQRESELASRLERLYCQLHQGSLVYIGGWQHLLGPSAGGTIYERLEHLQPRRLLLNGWAGM